MKQLLTLIFLLQIVLNGLAINSERVIIDYNYNWSFKLLAEAEVDNGFEKSEFDDSRWRNLDLPHDWGVEKGFDNALNNNTGLLPWKGIAWYRNTFKLSGEDDGKQIFIEFDGAMANAEVFCNGQLVGKWPYGYTSFSMNLTPYLKYGADNSLAVKLNTKEWDSRWYPGAGLYRGVRLVKTNKIHIPYNGIFITTPEISEEVGRISLQADVQNSSNKFEKFSIDVEVFQLMSEGKLEKVDSVFNTVELEIPSGKNHTVRLDGIVKNPNKWSLEETNRYLAKVKLKQNGKTIDTYEESFGFRTIDFTARDGFYLNGKRVELKGVCNHHDLGPLGGAFYVEAAKRQLVLLKEMGCNSIRTSHNPPAPELLDLCDEMGFLVQVEAFDCWRKGKREKDYNVSYDAWHVMDLESMVKRDRNHPSVVMWSTGNEMPDQWNNYLSVNMYNIVKALDPTRPITMGCNWGGAGTSGFQKGCDVFGINYNLWAYQQYFDHTDNEFRGVLASETSSCLSTRGEYFFPVNEGGANKNLPGPGIYHMSSYDVNFPGWGCTPDRQFEILKKFPAMYGEFVWTGFDYLGEPTPYNNDITNLLNFQNEKQKAEMQKRLDELGKIEVPSRSSYFGIMDLCGFKKDRFYNYQAHWRPDFPMAHILPHWNWKGREGEVTPVYVYTSGDEAELFLNGKSLGRKKKGEFEYRLKWNDVKYKAGTLKVIAYKDGAKWAEEEIQTTTKASQIELSAETFPVDNKSDLVFVTVDLNDKKGCFVSTANNELSFQVEGATIIATGNGDPTDHTPFISNHRKAFNGKCLIILKKKDQSSPVKLKVKSKGMKEATVVVK